MHDVAFSVQFGGRNHSGVRSSKGHFGRNRGRSLNTTSNFSTLQKQGVPFFSYSWPNQPNSQPNFNLSSYLNPPHQAHQPQPRPNLHRKNAKFAKKLGHIVAASRFRYAESRNNHYNPQNLQASFSALNLNPTATCSFTSSDIPEWLPDTTATSYMTSDPQMVESIQPYHGSNQVIVSNGNALSIS